MKTREEAVSAALEAADRTGRSMFVYQLLGNYAYGSRDWLDGMADRPRDLLEVKPRREVELIAQIEADRTGRSMLVHKHEGVWAIRQVEGTVINPRDRYVPDDS